MKIFRAINNYFNLKFKDPQMEKEYCEARVYNVAREFKIILIVIQILNMISLVQTTVTWNRDAVLNNIITTIVILPVFWVQKCFPKRIQLLTLITLIIYHVSRFYTIAFEYKKYVRGSLFFAGYAIAIVQSILIYRIQKTRHKVYGSIIAYAIRFGLIMGYADRQSFSYYTLTRGFVIDFFLIYTHYSSQQVERRVFRNFYENKQELLKFKELVAESLPQSVTVLDCNTLELLFRNVTFKNSFAEQDNPKCLTEELTVKTSPSAEDSDKPKFNSLRVDGSTIRESGGQELPLKISDLPHNFRLKEVITKIIKSNLLTEKAVSLIAFHTSPTQKRSFEIILKRIVWDRTDALALILNDITYQENLIALKVANKNKDQIIATVSHELRTPLHGIIGLVELADKKMPDPSGKDYLSLCKSNALLLLGLVNSLLDLHQLTTGKIKLNIVKVHLEEMVREVVKLFQFQAKQKRLLLDFDVSKNVPKEIQTDESRLRQILINLIGNAIKFTSRGSVTVQITQADQEDDYLKIAVIDTGIGIREADQSKLFQMYGRLKDSEALNKNGVGLGLTISNTLVSILNGKSNEKGIDVTSEHQKGSMFSFKILKNLEEKLIDSKPKMNEKPLALPNPKKRFGFSVEKLETERLTSDADELIIKPEKSEEGFDELLISDDINLKITGYSHRNKSPSNRSFDYPRLQTTPEFSRKHHPLTVQTAFSLPRFEGSRESLLIPGSTNSYRSHFAQTQRQKLIVVVDDNPFNLLIAESLVSNLGFSISTSGGGKEAIQDIQELSNQNREIHAILMDCQMPVMDGFETTRALIQMMENNQIPTTPIIAWTANNTEEDIKRCMECGMKDHLVKPTSQEAFSNVLSKILN